MAFLVGHTQTSSVDNLIAKLDNEKLFGTCNYVWVLKNGCKEADTLINIGKTKRTDKAALPIKLFNLLTDTAKGIIVHYVLTNIIYEGGITSGTIYFYDKDGTLEYNYNGLRFYQDNHRSMFVSKEELEHNKKVWTGLFRQMKLIE